MFPYQQLITASLVHENGADVVLLAFSSHDVEVTGRNLRELLVALQDFAVKWVRTTPNRYHGLGCTESGTVLAITIAAAD